MFLTLKKVGVAKQPNIKFLRGPSGPMEGV